MAKFEKEIKVLDIDIENMEKKLKKIGAKFKSEKHQKIYTYDIPTLYYRYLEILELIKTDNILLFNTNLIKLKILLIEIKDLVAEDSLDNICKEYKLNDILDIIELSKNDLLKVMSGKFMQSLFKDKLINQNKWIRLRQSNDKIELTVKHVFDKKSKNLQSVLETEIEVSSLSETNALLESVGLARRNYQEKVRRSYVYKTAEIEIDNWPLLKPYMEIECGDEKVIEELVKLLNLTNYEIVSLNTTQLYKRIGIDIQNMPELKFDTSS